MPKHYVVWSGGLDSTLIMDELIKRNYDPSAIVVYTDKFGYDKRELEYSSRAAMKSFWKKNIPTYTINLDIPFGGIFGAKGGIVQQPFMILNTFMFAPDDSVLWFGYHRGDDLFSHDASITASLNSLKSVLGEKKVALEYPFRFSDKSSIVTECEERGFVDLCHWCEYPVYGNQNNACGDCIPCRTFAEAKELQTLRRRNKRMVPLSWHTVGNYETKEENQIKAEVIDEVDLP